MGWSAYRDGYSDDFLDDISSRPSRRFARGVGEYDKAMLWLQQGLDSASRLTDDNSDARFRGDISNSLSELMLTKSDLREARRYAEICLAEMERFGMPAFISAAQETLASVHSQ